VDLLSVLEHSEPPRSQYFIRLPTPYGKLRVDILSDNPESAMSQGLVGDDAERANAMVNEAVRRAQRSEFVSAEELLLETVRRYPYCYDAFGVLCDVSLSLGRTADAVYFGRQVVALVPSYHNLTRLGRALGQDGKLHEAATVQYHLWQVRHEADREEALEAIHGYLVTLAKLDDPGPMTDVCAQALREYPGDPTLLYQLAYAFLLQGRLAEGHAVAERALATLPLSEQLVPRFVQIRDSVAAHLADLARAARPALTAGTAGDPYDSYGPYGAESHGANSHGAGSHGANSYGSDSYGSYGSDSYGSDSFGSDRYADASATSGAYPNNPYAANARAGGPAGGVNGVAASGFAAGAASSATLPPTAPSMTLPPTSSSMTLPPGMIPPAPPPAASSMTLPPTTLPPTTLPPTTLPPTTLPPTTLPPGVIPPAPPPGHQPDRIAPRGAHAAHTMPPGTIPPVPAHLPHTMPPGTIAPVNGTSVGHGPAGTSLTAPRPDPGYTDRRQPDPARRPDGSYGDDLGYHTGEYLRSRYGEEPPTPEPEFGLADIIAAVEGGNLPPADGGVTVVPGGGACAVLAFTAHAVVAADLDPDWIHGQLAPGDLSAPLNPPFLSALAGRTGRRVNNIDITMIAPRLVGRLPLPLSEIAARRHPRIERALHYREDVHAWATEGGLLILGRGVGGRWELAVEVEPGYRGEGLGRTLAAAGRHLVPGEMVWAQIAPGNAASVRAFLAAGFTPIGSEALLVQ
jgi:hypothetical protein